MVVPCQMPEDGAHCCTAISACGAFSQCRHKPHHQLLSRQEGHQLRSQALELIKPGNAEQASHTRKRQATIDRSTKETKIKATVDLDGTGAYDVATGVGFLDHMLEQLARHSLIDITLKAKGDLHIDFHHTTEDCGIVLGQAVAKALGDKQGITRYGVPICPWTRR